MHAYANLDPAQLRELLVKQGLLRPRAVAPEHGERITPHAEGVVVAPILRLQGSDAERAAVKRPIWADLRAARKAWR